MTPTIEPLGDAHLLPGNVVAVAAAAESRAHAHLGACIESGARKNDRGYSVARAFGVDQKIISKIFLGKAWSHVK
jgi:hypothetical protein